MHNQIKILAFYSSVGVIIGGILWLLIYDLRFTSDIKLDGPAILALMISMLIGWLVISLAGLIIYFKKHKSVSYKKAFIAIAVSGLLTGLIAGYILASTAHAQHPTPQYYN